MIRPSRLCLLVALPVALASCGKRPSGQQDLDSLDKELASANSPGNGKDPALTAALHDQIMVDPKLAQSSNANAARPPSRPGPGAMPPESLGARADTSAGPLRAAPSPNRNCPECRAAKGALTLGALAERGGGQAGAGCATNIRYSSAWANRLPAALPLYPDARVSEAAGNDSGGCALRVVSFTSAAPMNRVIDWYYTRATEGGYSAEHRAQGGQHVLGGSRGDAAYIVFFNPRAGGGTEVDLLTNAGR